MGGAVGGGRLLRLLPGLRDLGNLVFAAFHPGASALVGASGAGSGLMAAASRLLTHDRQLAPFFSRPVVMPGGPFLFINLIIAVVGWAPGAGDAQVAWKAHLGGYLAGLVLLAPSPRRPAQALMSKHSATVDWVLDGDFLARRYSRAHVIGFDGGVQVAGSASPEVVRAPFSRADAVDPEEAFVASLAACHMLWFLDFASRAGLVVTAYRDEAEGVLGEDSEGRTAMTQGDFDAEGDLRAAQNAVPRRARAPAPPGA